MDLDSGLLCPLTPGRGNLSCFPFCIVSQEALFSSSRRRNHHHISRTRRNWLCCVPTYSQLLHSACLGQRFVRVLIVRCTPVSLPTGDGGYFKVLHQSPEAQLGKCWFSHSSSENDRGSRWAASAERVGATVCRPDVRALRPESPPCRGERGLLLLRAEPWPEHVCSVALGPRLDLERSGVRPGVFPLMGALGRGREGRTGGGTCGCGLGWSHGSQTRGPGRGARAGPHAQISQVMST